MAWRAICLATVFFLPLISNAGVIFSEIMYDLDGADNKREWIEIYNSGSEGVEISGWRLKENDINHTLNIFQGSEILQESGVAVIADNAETFLTDWPEYSGVLFDSSFSLKNTGETLLLLDANLNEIDSVSYVPEWGASSDGMSLQKFNGTWTSAMPTPGIVSIENNEEESEGETGGSTIEAPVAQEYVPVLPTKNIKAFIKERTSHAFVGAASKFEGYALGLEDEPLNNARYIWNFGDGSKKEGQNILHTYSYPGVYIVVLSVASGGYTSEARMEIEAVPAEVSVILSKTPGDSSIAVSNNSSYELDLSGWFLRSGTSYFTLPENTIVLSRGTITIASATHSLGVEDTKVLELLYPNGTLAHRAEKEEIGEDTPKVLGTQGAEKEQKKQTLPRTSPKEYAKERVTEEETLEDENRDVEQTAFVSAPVSDNSITKNGSSFYIWLLSVALFSGLGIISYIALKRTPSVRLEPEEIAAEEFEIEELK